MKNLLTGILALLALTLAFPSMALTRLSSMEANHVLDAKIEGVYRPAFGEGALSFFKRHENTLYAVQGDSAGSFVIDSVQTNRSVDPVMVHLVGPNGDLTTLKLSFGLIEMTFSDGSTVNLKRVRDLIGHDQAKLDSVLPMIRPLGIDLDCDYVRTSVERAVCEKSTLTEMNTAMTAGYQALLRYAEGPEDAQFFRGQQQEWVAKRNQCESIECLEESYGRRLSVMGDMVNFLSNPQGQAQ